ncbi:MAG: pantetheine-phosphate adenylyltransferase [Spirochaetia bacterium]|nr:pantetheine-phosphate adenylyltransferase [Spirochaetia bacterium]MBQ3713618.1 pantetheine-phosphate adenylyltransferase [Spirochaetia bacterium]MBQ6673675.1 pantetheine-phosphate adenylyltransferase [Spirochaetia bacterium]MBR0319241.1 pantetheine-phosphate adenylyltransferase [Spirochaetia bacterium]
MQKKVIFPGTFDPVTNGHLNVIDRASKLFDKVEVVISVNPQKKTLFSVEERFDMMERLTSHYNNVHISVWDRLIVDFAKKIDTFLIIRGVRSITDFTYEFELSLMNRGLDPRIETLYMPTDSKYSLLKSSAIKELAYFGGNISKMVPPLVEEALKAKFSRGS